MTLGLLVVVTASAVLLIRSWAIPVWWTVISYMGNPDATDSEMIKDLWPHRIIQPDWLSSGSDLFGRWQHAEMHARITLVVIVWLAIVLALLYTAFRQRQPKRPNQSMKPTAS